MKMNLPNKLTVSRMIMVPIFVFFYLTSWVPSPAKDYIAMAIFTIASITDTLDGNIARKRNLVTDFGKFMDPLADKLLVGSALICFTGAGVVPAWAVVILIGREFVISGFRLVAANKGVVIAADLWGKAKTVVQMAAIIGLLLPWSYTWFHMLCLVLFYASVVLSIISVLNYILKNPDVLAEKE